jgi:hypothetical protein
MLRSPPKTSLPGRYAVHAGRLDWIPTSALESSPEGKQSELTRWRHPVAARRSERLASGVENYAIPR